MATTPNIGLTQPVNGNQTTWGAELRANNTIIDSEIQAIKDDLAGSVASQAYPVGSVYLSTSATDPATTFGFGTWTQIAEGRAIVGVGTADGLAWTNGEEKGVATHALTTAEMPTHTHGTSSLTAAAVGGHTHGVGAVTVGADEDNPSSDRAAAYFVADGSNNFDGNGGVGAGRVVADPGASGNGGSHVHSLSGATDSAGGHTHSLSGTLDSTGGGSAHTNVQPSFALYIWERTA